MPSSAGFYIRRCSSAGRAPARRGGKKALPREGSVRSAAAESAHPASTKKERGRQGALSSRAGLGGGGAGQVPASP
jgi:hypothetical protein